MPGAQPPLLTQNALRTLARARLDDARALLEAHRFDGGLYLCGYAVEIALKARVCRTLRWASWPDRGSYSSFFTHKLDVLLSLSGRETKIRTQFAVQWSIVATWDPESRYTPIGTITEGDLQVMIAAAEDLLDALK